jgi:hypothetical protein
VGRTLVANRWFAGSACGKWQRSWPLNAIARRHLDKLAEGMQRLLSIHQQFVCAAAIDAEGNIVAQIGDFETFGSKGLISSLLGPLGSPRDTFGSLAGDHLRPRSMRQGEEIAFYDYAGDRLAVVIIGRCEHSVGAHAKLWKEIGNSFAVTFPQRGKSDV